MSNFTLEDLNENVGTLCFVCLKRSVSLDELGKLEDENGEKFFESMTNVLREATETCVDKTSVTEVLNELFTGDEATVVIKIQGKYYNCLANGIGYNDCPIPEKNMRRIESLGEALPQFTDILKFLEHPDLPDKAMLWCDDDYSDAFDAAFTKYSESVFPKNGKTFNLPSK